MEHTPTTTLERQLIARAAALRRPVSGSLELTPLCNMNCRMCYVRLSPRQARAAGALRTGQQWAELAHPMARAGVLFLLLTGGEPLLVPGFKELYLALKAEGMVLTLNTNGTLLDEQWADFFARHKPRRVNITLYGADDAAYETLCRCPGGFEKTLAAMRLLRARGVDVKLNGSVTPENFGEMDRLYAIARQLDVPMHMDAYMMPGGPGRKNPAEGVRLAPAQAAARLETGRFDGLPDYICRSAEEFLRLLQQRQARRREADHGQTL